MQFGLRVNDILKNSTVSTSVQRMHMLTTFLSNIYCTTETT